MSNASQPAARRPYTRPRLVSYGDVRTLTLTEFFESPRNDKGSASTKTS